MLIISAVDNCTFTKWDKESGRKRKSSRIPSTSKTWICLSSGPSSESEVLGVQGTGLLRCMTHSNGGFCKGTGGGPGANGVTGAGAGVTGGVAVWLEGAGDWLV